MAGSRSRVAPAADGSAPRGTMWVILRERNDDHGGRLGRSWNASQRHGWTHITGLLRSLFRRLAARHDAVLGSSSSSVHLAPPLSYRICEFVDGDCGAIGFQLTGTRLTGTGLTGTTRVTGTHLCAAPCAAAGASP